MAYKELVEQLWARNSIALSEIEKSYGSYLYTIAFSI